MTRFRSVLVNKRRRCLSGSVHQPLGRPSPSSFSLQNKKRRYKKQNASGFLLVLAVTVVVAAVVVVVAAAAGVVIVVVDVVTGVVGRWRGAREYRDR